MKVLACAIFLIAVVASSLGMMPADAPVVGLEDSKHDFSHEDWTGGDLCLACHAQSSDEMPAEAPLWNPSADFQRTFGDALRREPGEERSAAGGGSIICMRCHDGTMARDMFGGLTAPSAVNIQHPAFLTSGHGGTSHPVGVEYPQFERDFRPMNFVLSEGKVLLPDGKVECISCHDPHNQEGARYMLTKSNERSALCLTCHRK
jgi:predicted CXXCH cytochrome family protein